MNVRRAEPSNSHRNAQRGRARDERARGRTKQARTAVRTTDIAR